jgi:hypothetical protein
VPKLTVFQVVTKNHVSPGIIRGFFYWNTERRYLLNFETFNSPPPVATGIAAAGYETPTPIQARAIPQVIKGHDVMGLAQTGTG